MKLCLRCNQYFEDKVETCPQDNVELAPVGKDPLIGSIIDDRYVVESVIGKGSSGIVYKATRLLMGREVAVKVLHSFLGADSGTLDRWLREARAASKLRHANIITLWDHGVTEDGQPYFVMDYLEGITIADLVRAQGAIHPSRTLNIVRQVCDALSEAHKQGIIHRDIKPENIVLQEMEHGDDYIKVLDFGICEQPQEATPKIEKPKYAAGSPAYMSPEQCQGFELDVRSDIYSLAIVVFEMLTAKRPFYAENLRTLMYMQVSAPPPLMSDVRKDIEFPTALELCLHKALSKKPDGRQESAKDFWKELEESCRGIDFGKPAVQPVMVDSVRAEQFSVSGVERLIVDIDETNTLTQGTKPIALSPPEMPPPMPSPMPLPMPSPMPPARQLGTSSWGSSPQNSASDKKDAGTEEGLASGLFSSSIFGSDKPAHGYNPDEMVRTGTELPGWGAPEPNNDYFNKITISGETSADSGVSNTLAGDGEAETSSSGEERKPADKAGDFVGNQDTTEPGGSAKGSTPNEPGAQEKGGASKPPSDNGLDKFEASSYRLGDREIEQGVECETGKFRALSDAALEKTPVPPPSKTPEQAPPSSPTRSTSDAVSKLLQSAREAGTRTGDAYNKIQIDKASSDGTPKPPPAPPPAPMPKVQADSNTPLPPQPAKALSPPAAPTQSLVPEAFATPDETARQRDDAARKRAEAVERLLKAAKQAQSAINNKLEEQATTKGGSPAGQPVKPPSIMDLAKQSTSIAGQPEEEEWPTTEQSQYDSARLRPISMQKLREAAEKAPPSPPPADVLQKETLSAPSPADAPKKDASPAPPPAEAPKKEAPAAPGALAESVLKTESLADKILKGEPAQAGKIDSAPQAPKAVETTVPPFPKSLAPPGPPADDDPRRLSAGQSEFKRRLAEAMGRSQGESEPKPPPPPEPEQPESQQNDWPQLREKAKIEQEFTGQIPRSQRASESNAALPGADTDDFQKRLSSALQKPAPESGGGIFGSAAKISSAVDDLFDKAIKPDTPKPSAKPSEPVLQAKSLSVPGDPLPEAKPIDPDDVSFTDVAAIEIEKGAKQEDELSSRVDKLWEKSQRDSHHRLMAQMAANDRLTTDSMVDRASIQANTDAEAPASGAAPPSASGAAPPSASGAAPPSASGAMSLRASGAMSLPAPAESTSKLPMPSDDAITRMLDAVNKAPPAVPRTSHEKMPPPQLPDFVNRATQNAGGPLTSGEFARMDFGRSDFGALGKQDPPKPDPAKMQARDFSRADFGKADFATLSSNRLDSLPGMPEIKRKPIDNLPHVNPDLLNKPKEGMPQPPQRPSEMAQQALQSHDQLPAIRERRHDSSNVQMDSAQKTAQVMGGKKENLESYYSGATTTGGSFLPGSKIKPPSRRQANQNVRTMQSGPRIPWMTVLLTVVFVAVGFFAYKFILAKQSTHERQAAQVTVDTLIKQNKLAEAMVALERQQDEAGKLKPNDASKLDGIYIDLARRSAKQHNFQDAIGLLQKVSKKSPRYGEAKSLMKKYKRKKL